MPCQTTYLLLQVLGIIFEYYLISNYISMVTSSCSNILLLSSCFHIKLIPPTPLTHTLANKQEVCCLVDWVLTSWSIYRLNSLAPFSILDHALNHALNPNQFKQCCLVYSLYELVKTHPLLAPLFHYMFWSIELYEIMKYSKIMKLWTLIRHYCLIYFFWRNMLPL